MAEAHPVGFRFPMQARERGAKLLHVDPHFSRTSAMCHEYVPIRAGSDIAFLGGLVRYILSNKRWFREYVLAYTNAATIINDEYVDAEELGGIFSGFDPETRAYDQSRQSWQYASESGQSKVDKPQDVKSESFSERAGHLENTLPLTDPTLNNPMCVLNILRRHYERYTPEMVSEVCGCTPEQFLTVAETLCENSGRERTSCLVYALGWTQHTTGVQIIRTASIVQLLLGNIGRPGGGIMAMRGHSSIQGSTDVPTLYELLPGYLPQPSTSAGHKDLKAYLDKETVKSGYWSNMPRFLISLLKAWYGDAASEANDYGFDWVPKIDANYSHLMQILRMAEGKVKGMFLLGQNPAAGAPNAVLHRAAMRQLKWLVVRDWYEIDSACFWYAGPESPNPKMIGTEVFFMPAATSPEKDGTFTNTQRLLQWHDQAIDPPDDCRTDTWFIYNLGKRLKQLYAGSTEKRDQGLLNLTWDYEYQEPHRLPDGSLSRIEDEPDVSRILREMNGYTVADRNQVAGFADLRDDGSTACGCWIYSGVYPANDRNRAAERNHTPGNYLNPTWGFSWPANRRILYNRASADPEGKPWSERKKLVWWSEQEQRWTGLDIPDFEVDKPPSYRPAENASGMAAIAGDAPFIMKADGRGWLFASTGVKDGPLPTHYEPVESPVSNAVYPNVRDNPTVELYTMPLNEKDPLDQQYPIVATTYRITEQYLSGPMSRFNSWLNELQPEMFIELSPELAAEKGIEHGGWMVAWNVRAEIEARAMVTKRIRPLNMGDRIIHQVGIPFHWGFAGETVGSIANDLTSIVADPNVSMHEVKAFTVNVRPGRLADRGTVRMDAPAPWPTRAQTPDTPKSNQPEGQAL